MNSLKSLGFGLIVLAACFALATPAWAALPGFTLLPGESFPVVSEAEQTKVSLESTSEQKLEATSLKAKLEWTSESSGKAAITLTGVKLNKTTACNTEGDAKEVVLLTGEASLAPTALSPPALGALVTLLSATVNCEATKVKISGSQIASVGGFDTKDTTSFKVGLKGSKGKPTISEYYNNEGKLTKATLLANFGAGNQAAAINTEKEAEYKTSKMVALKGAGAEFEAEPEWYGESTDDEMVITEQARVKCGKERLEGVSPKSGDASTSDVGPSFSECDLEVEEGGKTKTTKATIAAEGCDFEFLKPEEPTTGDFDSGFDISKCTGGAEGGIELTDEEAGAEAGDEAGVACYIYFPEQALGNGDEAKNDKEAEPFLSEEEVNEENVEGESEECPEAVETGTEPGPPPPPHHPHGPHHHHHYHHHMHWHHWHWTWWRWLIHFFFGI